MVGVKKIVANDDVGDGDECSRWRRVSDIDFGSMDSVNESLDHDNKKIDKMSDETDKTLQHDIFGSDEEQMESTNGEDEIAVENGGGMNHLQMDLEESEYEMAKLQLDNGLLLDDKSNFQKHVASLPVQLEQLPQYSLQQMHCNAQLRSMTFQARCVENDNSRTAFYTCRFVII